MPAPERKLVLTLASIQFIHVVDFMILMPLAPNLMRLFGITPSQYGLLVSAYTFSAGVSGILGVFFIDLLERRKLFLILLGGFIAGTLLCALSPTYGVLLFARAATGAFGGLMNAQILSIMSDVIPFERRGRAMGLLTTAFSMASIAGVPFGLWLSTYFNWHAPFLFLVLLGLGFTYTSYRFIPVLDQHLTKTRSNPILLIRKLFEVPNHLEALLFTFALIFLQFLIVPFISPSLVANAGFAEKDLPLVYFFGGLATMITAPQVGRAADYLGKMRVFIFFAVISCIPIYLITNLGPVPMAVLLTLTASFFVCSNGRMVSSMAIVTSAVKPELRGSFMSLNSSMQQLGAATASLVGSTLISKSPTGQILHYQSLGYIAIAVTALVIYLVKKVKTPDAAPSFAGENKLGTQTKAG